MGYTQRPTDHQDALSNETTGAFADNTTNAITAENIRTFVNDSFQDMILTSDIYADPLFVEDFNSDVRVPLSATVGVSLNTRLETVETTIATGTVDWTVPQGGILIHPDNYIDTNTTYALFSDSVDGLVPAGSGSQEEYLKIDGTWATPTTPNITATTGGVLSDADAVKFDGIQAEANKTIQGSLVSDSTGLDTAANTTAINALLNSLRNSGIIAT